MLEVFGIVGALLVLTVVLLFCAVVAAACFLASRA